MNSGVSGWKTWAVGRNPRRTLMRAAGWAVLTWLVLGVLVRPVRVSGDSMAPTVESGRLRLICPWRYAFRDPRAGEIVVIRLAGRRVVYLKRILAVPGDRLRFDRGVLWVNGREQPEPYVVFRGDWTTAEYPLGPGEYFMAGDNRSQPMAWHATGVVERERIVGSLIVGKGDR